MSSSRFFSTLMPLLTLLIGVFGAVGHANAKPHAPIDIQYQTNNPSASGFSDEPLLLTVTLKNKVDVDDLVVSIRLGSGLQSAALQTQYNYGVMPKDQLSTITLDVSAVSAGRYRVYITATAVIAGKSQGRNVVMPLSIGSVPTVSN